MILLQRDRPYDPALAAARSAKVKARREPLDLKSIVRSGYAWHMGFIYMMFGFAYMVYFTFFQKRLTADLGFSPQTAGVFFLVMGVFSLFCGVLWGTISDRIGRGRAIAAMCFIQAVASLLFAWWPSTTGLLISAVIYGLCSLAVPGIVGAGCGDQFGPVLASASLGFVTIFLGIGQVAGPYLAGALADWSGNLVYSYLMGAGVFFIGTVLALFLKETKWASELAKARQTCVAPSPPAESLRS
jgi:MFS family permease